MSKSYSVILRFCPKSYVYFLLIFVIIIIINCGYIENCKFSQECFYNKNSKYRTKCSPYGQCIYSYSMFLQTKNLESSIICVCSPGYTNFKENDEIKCCYEQKSQHVAFLLEIIGLGLGHYYLEKYSLFLFKLISMGIALSIILFFAIVNCLEFSIFYSKKLNGIFKVIINIVIVICFAYITGFQIFDIIMFSSNSYKDANGVELKHW